MKKSNIFWIGFSDLMTTLFFLMLVLYSVTFMVLSKKYPEINELNIKITEVEKENRNLKNQKHTLLTNIDELEKKLNVFYTVDKNLKPLKDNASLFKYEKEYKRFVLAFDVNFENNESEIASGKLKNFEQTKSKILKVGDELRKIIDELALQKQENNDMKNVSYLIIISGYASKLNEPDLLNDYTLSYHRAFNLWQYWMSYGINFEDNKYKGLIDLQLSGNGWGGVGRFKRDRHNNFISEKRNQRFIIQIVPKITDNQ